jgi:GNAT superfamily N-acetyltransferase
MTAPQITLSPATPADFDAWLPLWRAYQAFYESDIPHATTLVTWQRILAADEPIGAALAFDGERAVGMTHWIFQRSCWTVEHTCYLQDLYVVPDLRGSGLGRRLIEHVGAQARAAGSTAIQWMTHETNTTARLLYDRMAVRTGHIQYKQKFV